MFATDSFMNAEVTYREGRVRREWSGRRFSTVKRHKLDADAR
jgi:hypothetical protein